MTTGADTASAATPARVTPRAWYTLGVLTLVYACHAIDRGLPNILIEPIKAEFQLTDTQLGLFAGLAFGLAFSVAVLPSGYLGDRVNRRNFLALAVLSWSTLTAVCGLARSFVFLLAARLGVGACEAAAAPLVLPMLADIFPAGRRAFALGLLYMSNPAGVLVASAVGGYLAAEYGWRAAFLIAGAPGLVIAALLMTTIREPRRGAQETVEPDAEPPAKVAEAFVELKRRPALISLISGCAIIGLLSIAINAWTSSFFIRVHGLDLAQAGVIIGIGGGMCAMLGPPVYGWVADWLSLRNPRWPLRIVAIGALGSMTASLVMLFTPSLVISVIFFVLAEFLRAGYPPPTYSVLMTATPPRIRSSTMSIVQFITNLVGFGLGPLVTGALSDYFGGGTAIRYAMASICSLFLVAALLIYLASRMLFKDPPPAAANP